MTSPPSKRDKDRKGRLSAADKVRLECTAEAFVRRAVARFALAPSERQIKEAARKAAAPILRVKEAEARKVRKAKTEGKARQAEKENVESVWTESGKAE